MRNISPQHRLSLTALAAFTALSAAPLFAQVADPAPPVIDVPAPPVIAPPPPMQAEAAPAPSASMATIGQPVIHTEPTPAPRVEESARPVARASVVKTVPVPAPAPAAIVRSMTPASAPVAASAPKAAVQIAPAPAPSTVERRIVTSTQDDRTAEIVGGALALLALGGGAFALSRRKRDEDADDREERFGNGYTPSPAVTPFAMTQVQPRFAPAASAATLPNGFDLSRFGPHMQAAYRGPSEDNPSHSLRRRLHRAAFFDRRAREAKAMNMLATAPLAIQPAVARRVDREDQIVVRPAPVRAGHFRPQPAWS